jgi:predicted RNA binding protein YcfA (HicA-like mRNA interferase family)
MTRLPVVSGEDCIRVFKKLGYLSARHRGSHVWLVCPGRAPVPVPLHRELGPGLLRKILKIADISVDEFIRLSKK